VTSSPWPLRSGPLLLRYATLDDAERLLAFRNDAEVNRWTLRTHVEPQTFLTELVAVPGSDTDFGCVAEQDGEVVAIGFLEVRDGSGQPGRPERTEAVLGYVVDPVHAGRGVATHLARGLLAAAFETLGVRRVTAYCYADNVASVRVLEKTGMRREQHCVEDSWHAELGWVDSYGYGLLDREWTAQRTAAQRA
jgi:RimJ/RimL family protein N-acetyltransferase